MDQTDIEFQSRIDEDHIRRVANSDFRNITKASPLFSGTMDDTDDDDHVPCMPEKHGSRGADFNRKYPDRNGNNDGNNENTACAEFVISTPKFQFDINESLNSLNMAALQSVIEESATENDSSQWDGDYENCSDTNGSVREEYAFGNNGNIAKKMYEDEDYENNYCGKVDTCEPYDYIDRMGGESNYVYSNDKEDSVLGDYDYIDKLCTENSEENNTTKDDSSDEYENADIISRERIHNNGKDKKEELSGDNDYVRNNCGDSQYVDNDDTKNLILGDNGDYDYVDKICGESKYVNNNDTKNAFLGDNDCIDNICGESDYEDCSITKDSTCGDHNNTIGMDVEQYKSAGPFETNVFTEDSNDKSDICAAASTDVPLDSTLTVNVNKLCESNRQFKNSDEGVKPVEIGRGLQNNGTDKMLANGDPRYDEITKNINGSREVFVDSIENSMHSDMYIVQMVECPPQVSIQKGTFIIDIALNGLRLLDIKTEIQHMFWPFNGIRRFGLQKERGRFLFEAGRRCEKGPGVYAFQSDNPETIYTGTMKKSKGK